MRWQILRATLRRLLFPAVIAFTQLAPAAIAQPQDEQKRVLVLYSTRANSQFSIVGENELPRLLDAGLARNLDYYSEFFDRGRFSDPSYRATFRDFLRVKYQAVRFDLVIAVQDEAVGLVAEYRGDLFSETPIVYLRNEPTEAPRIPNATGLNHLRNYTGTLTFLRQLQPDVKNVFVVTGASFVDREHENAFRRQLVSYNSPLNIAYLSGLATSELEQRLSRLPPHSAVFHVFVTRDGAGEFVHSTEYADRVSAAANAPTYSWIDSAMGHGILGGSLYTQRPAIIRLGELALRVLNGEDADSIPVIDLDVNVNHVDWRQLQRWGIDESRIPAGTLIEFRDPTVWDEYGPYILAALAVLLTQAGLILALLLQRRRRQRAEEDLRGSQSELRKSYDRNRDLGSRLLRAQETEHSRIAQELHDDICQRMMLLTIELESLRHAGKDDGMAAGALSLAQDISRSLHDLSHRLHPTRLRLIGLVAALDQLQHEVSRAGLAVGFTHENVPPLLAPDVMLCLFRIVQEALQNAIKYSGATEVLIDLRGGSGGLILEIADNGRGFDVESAWTKGLGLVSMSERMDAIGGSFEIRSKPGAGTSLTARVPAHTVQQTDTARLVA